MNDFEVPERTVVHDLDDDADGGWELGNGDATLLPMSVPAKAAARRRRERLDAMGGFGFGASA